jgi:hypothetical protein
MSVYSITLHEFIFRSVLCYESNYHSSVSLFYEPQIDDDILHKI